MTSVTLDLSGRINGSGGLEPIALYSYDIANFMERATQ
jgi:hypothetical protein